MLSKVSVLNKQACNALCEALPKLSNLRNLDLSNNGLGSNELANLFEALSNEHLGPCNLRSLNVSQNNAAPSPEAKTIGAQHAERFSDRL